MNVLFVDDLRMPVKWQDPKYNVTICRTYAEAIECLAFRKYDVVDLDHDLGEEKTGYDICKYIVEKGINVPTIVTHTANPVGRENMAQLLNRYTKSTIIKI